MARRLSPPRSKKLSSRAMNSHGRYLAHTWRSVVPCRAGLGACAANFRRRLSARKPYARAPPGAPCRRCSPGFPVRRSRLRAACMTAAWRTGNRATHLASVRPPRMEGRRKPTAFVLACLHRRDSLPHARISAEPMFDLAQFHALPAQFHLAIRAAQNLQLARVGPSSQVAGRIAPAAGSLDETGGGEIGPFQIAQGEPHATQPDAPHRAGRNRPPRQSRMWTDVLASGLPTVSRCARGATNPKLVATVFSGGRSR